MNIAFVSRELLGLNKNGGIGTAVTHACEQFAHRSDFHVHVYYTGRPRWGMVDCAKKLRTEGVAVHFMPWVLNLALGYRQRAWHTYLALRNTQHDVYIFHDFMADGFFCFQAKSKENAFTGAKLGIVSHGSSEWVDEGNGCSPPDANRQQLYAMEQECCEKADFLVSPSAYLVDWMRAKNWKLPYVCRCIGNFSSPPLYADAPIHPKELASSEVRELVFFGRLEERKGIRVFCDALAMLPLELLAGRTVTFLGKEDHYSVQRIRSLLDPIVQRSDVKLLFLPRYDSLEARNYLNRDGVLAIMPSLCENSPCVVNECLAGGIPFITSSVGGGKELILEEDRERAICAPQKEILAERLLRVLVVEGIQAARPVRSQAALYEDWKTLLLEELFNLETID